MFLYFVFLSLKERVDFANRGNYDYFISFHRNAFRPEVANGAETFVHPKASPKARKLAEDIQRALVECGFRNRGVKPADFYVLRATKMPAILIEIGFIDNSMYNDLFDSKKKRNYKSDFKGNNIRKMMMEVEADFFIAINFYKSTIFIFKSYYPRNSVMYN